MTVIPAWVGLIDENDSAVKLAKYAQIIQLPEDQFFGILNDDTLLDKACAPIWTLPMRQLIARYLREAQEEIEQVVGYPLAPRWFTNEEHPYAFPVFAKWGKMIAGGFKAQTVIHAAGVLSYATDPATFTHATTVTDSDEIRVYHPSTFIEIVPSSIVISGGNVTVSIPWARLIEATSVNNPVTGWTYADVPPSATSPYTPTIDLYRVYNDDSIQGALVYPHKAGDGTCSCDCGWCCGTCDEYAATACMYIRDLETGSVDLLPASYAASYWTAVCPTCYCTNPEYVRINYEAGLQTMTNQIEDAIVRLCHSKLPSPPCGCGVVHEMWTRDRAVPPVVDAKRMDCPFGLSDGAWFAWKQALAVRLQRGMAF